MKTFELELRVRYAETDQMGVVHHANYALYLETARIEWLREIGISYKKMEEEGVMLPVFSMALNFKKPAYYDNVIKVKTKLKNKPTSRVEFEYEIVNEKDEILTTASTVLVFVDSKTKRPIKAPQYFLEAVED